MQHCIGGSTGIGYEICQTFLSNGYTIINLSRTKCELPSVNNICIDLLCALDKTETMQQMQNLIRVGASEIHLIFCASNDVSDGIFSDASENMTESLMINAVNPSILTSLMLPLMDSKSSVLFIGSTLSHKCVPNRMSYSVSKHAQIGLMRSIVQDLIAKKNEKNSKSKKSIHSCVICPGFCDTQMLSGAGVDSEFIDSFVGIGRVIQPKEIASFVYTVSQSPILNGSVLDANGGQKES